MKFKSNRSGFTLLEIIIVIIIVGVLASLALPRFFQTVEFSRSNEAMNIIGAAKRAADRCSIMSGVGVNYAPCITFPALAMDVPGLVPGSHFCYEITRSGGNWILEAERNNVDNSGAGAACDANGEGTGVGDTITLTLNEAAGTVTKSGTGVFAGIQ